MATVYSGYSKGWKPSGSDIYKKYRARLDYSLVSETATTITYRAILYVNINSSVNAPYTGTLNIGGTTYTGSCETVFGEGNTVTCVSAKTKTFNKGATATTATISGGVRSSKGSWTGATVTASATVSIPALVPATITFNANGGSGTVPSAISTYVGVANTIPSNSLTRTGYTFNGWNTASDGSGTAYATGSTITPTGDVTLYAQWKTTYVKPEIQNLLAFRTADASGGASPTVTSTGTTGFCKFQLVGGANYTLTSATVQFGTTTTKSMTKSGSTIYGYSTVGSIAQESAYTVKITVVAKGTDGVSRTYTDSTYISKSVPTFDVSANGNSFALGGTARDGSGKYFDCYMHPTFFTMAGEIKMWAGNKIPDGWLLCDGSEVSKTTYPNLYAAIGDLWGTPNSSSNFKLPNLKGRVPVGHDSTDEDFGTVGGTGGAKSRELCAAIGACNDGPASLGYVAEAMTSYQSSHSASYVVRGASWEPMKNWNHSTPVTERYSSNRATSFLQPYAVIKYIICAI